MAPKPKDKVYSGSLTDADKGEILADVAAKKKADKEVAAKIKADKTSAELGIKKPAASGAVDAREVLHHQDGLSGRRAANILYSKLRRRTHIEPNRRRCPAGTPFRQRR